MKKWWIDKNYLKLSIYAFFLIVAVIIFEKLIGNMGLVYTSITAFLSFLGKILTPFLYGFSMAYLFNPLVRIVDRFQGYIPGYKSSRIKRAVSILLTLVMSVALLTFIIRYITPEIITSFKNLSDNIQYYVSIVDSSGSPQITNESIALFFNNAMLELDNFLNSINAIFETSYSSGPIVDSIVSFINQFIGSIPDILLSIFSGTISFAGSLFNMFIGLFIAFYMLMGKENYARSATRIIFASFKKPKAEKVLASFQNAHRVFEKFILGKSLDSLIIGILFFLIAMVLKLPYSLLLAVIIGVSNMIPFLGPFIGAVPVILIVLLTSLGKITATTPFSLYPTVFTALSIFILQQIDGNVIGPKILGESTGLTALEVIFAIIVGGAIFGILGMFLGVPVLAVIKAMIKTLIDRKYTERTTEKTEDTHDQA